MGKVPIASPGMEAFRQPSGLGGTDDEGGAAMATILQVDFPFSGPWGDTAAGAMADLANVIAQAPGLRWKIWTESERDGMAGGIYCFDDEASARAYMAEHEARLTAFGITGIRAMFFDVNDGLTAVNHGPVS